VNTYQGDALREQMRQPAASVWPTGLAKIDHALEGGLRSNDLSVIGASTGFGKSALVEQIALHVAQTRDVLFIPLEMGCPDTRIRLAAKMARCSVTDFARTGCDAMTQTQLNRLALHLWEPPEPWGVGKLLEFIADSGCKFVVLDHARHIEGWVQDDARSVHVGPTLIVRRLRDAARDLQIHIVLCAQLNRLGYNKRPMLSHLQDTSALEQTAAVVLLLNRPRYHQGKTRDNITEVILAKNRYGPSCKIMYRWVGPTMTLWPMTDEEIAMERHLSEAEVES
jgi:replicative DNA helicase